MERLRSRNLVRLARPSMCSAATRATRRLTPLAIRPESVGYPTSAGTTVVSALRRLVFRTLLLAALSSSARLRASTAPGPQRLAIFFSAEWSGTEPPRGTRQKRDQLTESVTCRQRAS